MGWNDRLDDPDAWEAAEAAMWEHADLMRKRAKETAFMCEIDESAGLAEDDGGQ